MDSVGSERPGIGTALLRGWRRRCPRCGADDMFSGFFRIRPRCEACGLVTRREDGGMTGQMYLSAAVTELFAALLVAAVFLLTDWDPWTSIAVGLPLVIAFAYWTLPRFTALWVAIEYLTDRVNQESWTDDGA